MCIGCYNIRLTQDLGKRFRRERGMEADVFITAPAVLQVKWNTLQLIIDSGFLQVYEANTLHSISAPANPPRSRGPYLALSAPCPSLRGQYFALNHCACRPPSLRGQYFGCIEQSSLFFRRPCLFPTCYFFSKKNFSKRQGSV